MKKANQGYCRFINDISSPKNPEYKSLSILKWSIRLAMGINLELILNLALQTLKSESFYVHFIKSMNVVKFRVNNTNATIINITKDM